MDQPISPVAATRNFSRLLREVRHGRSYVVTVRGKPIARIVPYADADAVRTIARSALLHRLTAQSAIEVGPWTRNGLYER